MRNDSFSVFNSPTTQEFDDITIMGTEPQQALQRAVRGLLDSGKYSDFTIKCGADEYKVHKAIVCPRSRFFDAVFTHDMQVSVASCGATTHSLSIYKEIGEPN